MGGLTGRMKEQHFFPGPHKANRNDTEIVRGEIPSMFFQNKWEKRQRECTVWRAGKKDAKQLWHKLPVLQDSSTSTALGKQKNVPMLQTTTYLKYCFSYISVTGMMEYNH